MRTKETVCIRLVSKPRLCPAGGYAEWLDSPELRARSSMSVFPLSPGYLPELRDGGLQSRVGFQQQAHGGTPSARARWPRLPGHEAFLQCDETWWTGLFGVNGPVQDAYGCGRHDGRKGSWIYLRDSPRWYCLFLHHLQVDTAMAKSGAPVSVLCWRELHIWQTI